jgi:integrase
VAGEAHIVSRPLPRGRDRNGLEVWELRVSLGRIPDSSPPRYDRYIERFHGGITLANRRLRALEHLRDEGKLLAEVRPDPETVAGWLDDWCDGLATAQLAARTIARHRGIIDKHLKPALGDVKLVDLTTADIERYIAARLKDGAAPQTITHERNCLRSALGHAVRVGRLTSNPAASVRWRHKPQPKQLRTLTEDETQKLLRGLDGDLHAAAYLAVTTGMRRGEVLGLRISDVDFDGAVLSIRQVLEEVAGSPVTVKAPKTRGSFATIDLAPGTVEVLRQQKVRVAEAKLRAGKKWAEHGLLFPAMDTHRGRKPGGYQRPGSWTRRFVRAAEAAGVPCTPHMLRHSHGYHLLRRGVPMKDVSARLRHSSVSFTMDRYVDTLPADSRAAADAVPAF